MMICDKCCFIGSNPDGWYRGRLYYSEYYKDVDVDYTLCPACHTSLISMLSRYNAANEKAKKDFWVNVLVDKWYHGEIT